MKRGVILNHTVMVVEGRGEINSRKPALKRFLLASSRGKPYIQRMSIRWGLCCLFREENIKYRTTTAKAVSGLSTAERLRKISALCEANAHSLHLALDALERLGIEAYRISSGLLPLKTHPDFGYELSKLPGAGEIRGLLETAGRRASASGIRLSFHPDQFVVLNSPRPEVVTAAMRDLLYHLELAELLDADVINIHGGGAYGDPDTALQRLGRVLEKLPGDLLRRLTLENDDRTYPPSLLAPVCLNAGIPLVYDAHHHRCRPDDLSVKEATDLALSTWDREPLFHLSSPAGGPDAKDLKPHHDYIDFRDVPRYWLEIAEGRRLTVDVEAKAKELAVLKIRDEASLIAQAALVPH